MGLAVLPENATEAQVVRGGQQQFTTTQASDWVRSADWLSMPVVLPTDNKFVGLLAITDTDANYTALNAAGNYTVDWGDGSTPEDFSSGVQANHQYTYSSIPASTASSRGYRQVFVTVTPQAGQSFTTINLHVKHTRSGLPVYETRWLDLLIAGPSLTTVTTSGAATPNVNFRLMERARLLSSATTSCLRQFQSCDALRTVSWASSGSVTATQSMFSDCKNLQSVSLPDLSSVTNMVSMFQNCYSLRSVSINSAASGPNMDSLFANCFSLRSVSLPSMSSVKSVAGMFSGCYSLQSVEFSDNPAPTSMNSLFASCSSLYSAPLIDASAIVATSSPFSQCGSLARGGQLAGLRFSVSYANASYSATGIESILEYLGAAYGAATVTISTNPGASGQVSLSGTTTSGSTTVTMADTTGLSTSMEISGTGISSSVSATVQDSGDTFTRTAHGLSDGDRVGVLTLNGAGGGIALNTPYYVVNKTANTFQVADTAGGSAKTITATPKFASMTSGFSDTDANNYTTASVALKAGRLYLLSVENSHGTSATAISSITGGAGVPTFTSRVTTNLGPSATLNRVSIWSAVPSADYTGTLTINFGGTTQTGACWSLVEVVNVDTATTDGIVTSNSARGSSTTPSVTAAALATSTNALFGAFGSLATAGAPIGRYTEVHDVAASTPAQSLQTVYQSVVSETIDRTISETTTSANFGACYVEIKAGTATADGDATINYGTTISSIVTNTSVTLSVPASASGTITTSSALLKRSKARIRGFTVSG